MSNHNQGDIHFIMKMHDSLFAHKVKKEKSKMRIVKFLLLKVLEIGGFLGIPYLIGKLLWIPAYIEEMEWAFQKCFWSIWFWGILNLVGGLAGLACITGVSFFIHKNWEWAGKKRK